MNKPVEAVPATAALDPILMEVVRYKLESITEEMQSSLIRGSFSPIVKEALDASCCLFTPDGTTVAQSRSNPSHLGSLIYSVRAIVENYPVAAMQDGDIYIFNDPYLGGTHIPDIAVVIPVIGDRRVVALTASIAHHIDLGGTIPGSSAANATDIFHEGLRIPPLQLARAGRIDDGLLRLIRQNTRMPDMVTGDLNAQIAAGKIAVRRLAELGSRYGYALVSVIFEKLIARSERMTRDALRKLPQGTFTYEDTLDNDGVDLDRRVTIRVAVTIEDGAVEFDFAGTSPQVKGPMNIVPSGVYSAACYGVRAITDPSIPTNGGCFRPVSIKTPAGSLVNPREGAPVNGRTHPMKRIASCIVGALAQALPDRFAAPAAASLLVLTFGGRWPNGRNFVVTDLINGASGGAQGQDGVDCIATDMTNGMSMTEEALEMEAPIRLIRNELRSGTGGAGEFRGGVGIVREYEILHGPVKFSHRGERHFSHAGGLLGGGAGASAHSEIRRCDGSVEEIPSKIVTTLETGDRVLIKTPAGGGYGEPRRRARAAVRADVANGKIDAEAARTVYGYPGAAASRVPALVAAVGTVLCLSYMADAAAQSYPSKPVRMIVPFPAGGPADALSRVLMPKLAENLGQQVVVDNRVGANGNVGAELTAKSAPDGYTLMMVVSSFASNPALYGSLAFDPLKDFAPVSLLTSAPLILVVHPTLPVKSVKDLVALAKARPGELNYAAAGNGAGGHLTMELFKGMTGVNMVTIIYKGGAQALTDVIGGQVHLTVNNPLVVLPHVKTGRLRPLGVTSLARLPAAPDLPTIAEAGVPGFEATLWYGVVAPAHTPAALVSRLHGELVKVLQQADVRERLAIDGVRIIGSTPEQFGEHLRHESAKWTKVIRDAKIKLE